MKIIDGIKYYSGAEVAALIGKNVQIVRLWARWSDEREAEGLERFIPKPIIIGKCNTRYWSEYDLQLIGHFSVYKPHGLLREYSKRQYSKRYKKYIEEHKKEDADIVLANAITELENILGEV